MAEQKSRRRGLLIAALVAAIVLAAAGIGWLIGRDGATDPGEAVATSTGTPSSASTTATDGACDLPAGSQEVPTEGPDATWEVRRELTVPSSPDYGPGKVDSSSRSCFAHNPMGAVFFILNFQGMPPEEQLPRIEGGDVTLEELEAATTTAGEVLSVRGFRIDSAEADKVTATIVYSFANGPLTANPVTMVWVDGDWKLDGATDDGDSQTVSSLDGFVEWGPA